MAIYLVEVIRAGQRSGTTYTVGRNGMVDAPAAFVGNHAMLMYSDPQEHRAACVQYVKAAAATDAAVLVAVTSEHLDGLDSQLPFDGIDAVLCDLSDHGDDPGRVLSLIRTFVRENADRPVRCLQDVGWLGRRPEYLSEAIVYETLLREALAASRAEVLCGYDCHLDPNVLAAAAREHPVVCHGMSAHASVAFAEKLKACEVVDQALSRPPAGASALTFRAEQGEVRRITASRAREAGLPAGRVTDLVIAVGELAGNTMLHTNSTGTLIIWTTDDEIVCQVSDCGQITDPLAGTLSPAPDDIGSRRGLWLVHQVSDLVQVRTGPTGTTVRVHMGLPAGGAGR